MASAIVLCAGFGTRLRPLTDELPKPLVPVGDRSILEHALASLAGSDFDAIALNVHHLAGLFERKLAQLALPIRVVHEAEIRGTAGGVAGARGVLGSAPVLVWNGDILVDPPVAELLRGAQEHPFCFGVAPRPRGEGTVGLDERGHVVRLRGERFGNEVRGGDYVGVLALSAAACDALPEHGCLFGDAALPWLRAGGMVGSVSVTRPWTDAGDARGLLTANLFWLAERHLESFVGEGAEVAGSVEFCRSLVGAGARILGAGRLDQCVICPGATASAPLSRAIVAPSGRVIPVDA